MSSCRMETSEFSVNSESPNQIKRLKHNLTLDFHDCNSKAKRASTLLQSPDLNMLMLASPELEKMIIQANCGSLITTPTPTQFIFPKHVTEEQEAYARGFVDALAQLQKIQERHSDVDKPCLKLVSQETHACYPKHIEFSNCNVSVNDCVFDENSCCDSTFTECSTALPMDTVVSSKGQLAKTISHSDGAIMSYGSLSPSSKLVVVDADLTGGDSNSDNGLGTAHYSNSSSDADMHMDNCFTKIKRESLVIPSMKSSNPLSPINMESQERIKLERKRARNRLAARKCRTRKLEKISLLEERVLDLKGQNGELLNSATKLRKQVVKLKEQIVEHINNGCQIMPINNSINLTKYF